MAVVLTDIQGRTAPGVDARCGLWSVEAAPATKRHHVAVTAFMPFAYGTKPKGNGISGWPQEGSS
jgi:hypothetical protein